MMYEVTVDGRFGYMSRVIYAKDASEAMDTATLYGKVINIKKIE